MRLCSEFGGDVQRITTFMSQTMRYLTRSAEYTSTVSGEAARTARQRATRR